MAQTITTDASAPTLFHVAQQYAGDALLAWRLAQASGITDPWLTTITAVIVPDGPAPQGDGLPPY